MSNLTNNIQQSTKTNSFIKIVITAIIFLVFLPIVVLTAILMINISTFPTKGTVAKISDDYMQGVVEGSNVINSELKSFEPVKYTRLNSSYYIESNRRNVSTSFAYVFENIGGDYYYVGVNWERYLWPFKKDITPRIINATSDPKTNGLWLKRSSLREELEVKKLLKVEIDECNTTLLALPADATSKEWRMALTDSKVCREIKERFAN